MAQTPALAKVGVAPLMQANHHLDSLVHEPGQIEVTAKAPVHDESVAALQAPEEPVPQLSVAEHALLDFLTDYNGGVYLAKQPSWEGVIHRTLQLSNHAVATLCRTLDAMHVAMALELRASALATTDKRQRALATAAGLKLLTP